MKQFHHFQLHMTLIDPAKLFELHTKPTILILDNPYLIQEWDSQSFSMETFDILIMNHKENVKHQSGRQTNHLSPSSLILILD